MKKLLNLGVSDPLTLGMAHPIADRLETLGRARPTTWRSRSLALGAMSLLAVATAPLSIASEGEKADFKFKYVTEISGEKNRNFEIVTENGEFTAYQFLENDERQRVPLTQNEDGTFTLTFVDGESVELPSFGFEEFRSLESLKALKGLSGLKNLEDLHALQNLKSLEELKMGDVKIHVSIPKNGDFAFDDPEGLFADLPKELREKIASGERINGVKIVENFEGEFEVSSLMDGMFHLPDSVINMDLSMETSDNPLVTAKRQLERAKSQLSNLAEDETIAFDLESALQDIERARKSLEAAEKRMSSVK